MILYHGTTLVAWENIRQNGVIADINANTELDFGKGFYASFPKDRKYAVKHALVAAKENFKRAEIKENTVLIKLEIDENLFKNKLVFNKRNKKFIDFVFDTRKNYLNENLPYDVIIGFMADGTVDILMSFYLEHENALTAKFVKWCYKLPFNLHRQIVIKSQELCDKITILEVTNLKGDVIYEQKEN